MVSVGPELRAWWGRPVAPLVALAATQLAVHLALNGAYGFHTDELYYLAAGRHPALGYVDFPPVTPLLAWLNTAIFGIHPWTLRLFPALTSSAVVLLTGLSARELGAGRRIAALASAVALLSLYLLATWLFQTVEFDELTWMLALYLLLRLIRSGDARLFVPLGLILGVGIETKLTVAALWIAIVFAIVASDRLRPLLRTPYPWLGLATAVALALPNLGWQVANGFPTLTYTANHGRDISQSGGVVSFLGLFALLIGPAFLPLFAAGLLWLFRSREFRPVALLVIVAVILFLPEGKAYYPAPTVPLVLAAGCVALGGITTAQRRRWLTAVLLVGGVVEAVVLSPVILPVVPPSAMHRSGIDQLNPDWANTYGWPEMTHQIAAVYNRLPPEERSRAAILTAIDGQAGAIDVYGPADHLPAAISPHLSFWYWKPAGLNPSTLVTVGYQPGELSFLCGSVDPVGTVVIPYSIANLNQGAPILLCTDLKEPLPAAWPALRNFS